MVHFSPSPFIHFFSGLEMNMWTSSGRKRKDRDAALEQAFPEIRDTRETVQGTAHTVRRRFSSAETKDPYDTSHIVQDDWCPRTGWASAATTSITSLAAFIVDMVRYLIRLF